MRRFKQNRSLIALLLTALQPALSHASAYSLFNDWLSVQRAKSGNPILVGPDTADKLTSASPSELQKLADQISKRKRIEVAHLLENLEPLLDQLSKPELFFSAAAIQGLIHKEFLQENLEYDIETVVIYLKLDPEGKHSATHLRRFLGHDWVRLYVEVLRYTLAKNPPLPVLRDLLADAESLDSNLKAQPTKDPSHVRELTEFMFMLRDRISREPADHKFAKRSPTTSWIDNIRKNSTPSAHLHEDDFEPLLKSRVLFLADLYFGEDQNLFSLAELSSLPYPRQLFVIELLDLHYQLDPDFLSEFQDYLEFTPRDYTRMVSRYTEDAVRADGDPAASELWLNLHRNRGLIEAIKKESVGTGIQAHRKLVGPIVKLWVSSLATAPEKWVREIQLIDPEELRVGMRFLLKYGSASVQKPIASLLISDRALEDPEIAVPMIRARIQKNLDPSLAWRLYSAHQLFFSGEGVARSCDIYLRSLK